MDETRKVFMTWWSRGGGPAVLFLLATVVWFREARDLIFWAAIAFFLAHTAITVLRFRSDRQARITATVIRHHRSHRFGQPSPTPVPLVCHPVPITSLIRLDLPPK